MANEVHRVQVGGVKEGLAELERDKQDRPGGFAGSGGLGRIMGASSLCPPPPSGPGAIFRSPTPPPPLNNSQSCLAPLQLPQLLAPANIHKTGPWSSLWDKRFSRLGKWGATGPWWGSCPSGSGERDQGLKIAWC